MKGVLTQLVLVLLAASAIAAPSQPSVSGSIAAGQAITITGTGFGGGPTVRLYDEFTGTAGTDVSLSATVGSWTNYDDANHPKYISDGTNSAALMLDGTTMRAIDAEFSNTTEFFISYKVKVPTGYWFPDASAEGQLNTSVSCWKMAWLMDKPATATADDDIVIPTRGDTSHWTIAGNDGGISGSPVYAIDTPDASNWFVLGGWNRVSAYLKGGSPDVTVNPGIIWFQGMSESRGQKVVSLTDRTVFNGDTNTWDDATPEWNKVNLGAWHNAGVAGSNARGIYDDVYIATGPNARARVEIGNNATYASCTKLAILTPTSWSDTSIVATVRQGEYVVGEQVYLFVVDADGVASAGRAVTFSGGTGKRYKNVRFIEE